MGGDAKTYTKSQLHIIKHSCRCVLLCFIVLFILEYFSFEQNITIYLFNKLLLLWWLHVAFKEIVLTAALG